MISRQTRILCLLGLIFTLSACGSPSSKPSHQMDKTAEVSENEIKVEVNETPITSGQLGGLYIDAGDKTPIILIIPGSGPTDLDGNNPAGISAATYKLLAHGLAKDGISTVRVDKRGMFSSEQAGDPNQVSVDIYAKDYSGWVDRIIERTNAPCVYVLGHSEGGLMGSATARLNKNICGLILVSAPGRPLSEILKEQLQANPANAPLLDEALDAIAKLETGERVSTETMHRALRPLFHDDVQDYLISLINIDPADLAKSAGIKTLVIHGTTDIQTSVRDAKILADATGGTLKIIEGINHVLKKAPENQLLNIRTYGDPDLPISPEVVEAIAEFVEPK